MMHGVHQAADGDRRIVTLYLTVYFTLFDFHMYVTVLACVLEMGYVTMNRNILSGKHNRLVLDHVGKMTLSGQDVYMYTFL